MAGTYLELWMLQNNDETVELTINTDDGPLDLETATAIELLIKPSKVTVDDDAAVVKLTLDDGDIDIVDAPAGRCDASVPAGVLATAGKRWWRCDVIVSGDRKTALYGPLLIRDT